MDKYDRLDIWPRIYHGIYLNITRDRIATVRQYLIFQKFMHRGFMQLLKCDMKFLYKAYHNGA
jgi:hypothetical protein